MLNSTRRNIQYPNPDFSDRPNIPAHMKFLIDALEVDMIYVQGAASVRLGRTHMEGVFYYETDTTLSWYDDGTTWHRISGAGTELDYAQVTSNSSSISATTEATAVTVITGNSVVYDGSRVKLEAFFPSNVPVASAQSTHVFIRDTTAIGQIPVMLGFTGNKHSASIHMFDTPSAGAHTYKVAVFMASSSVTVQAGAGGTGVLAPAFLRVTRA